MGRVLVYVVPVALAIYALIDLWRSRPQERLGVHPAVWALIIVLLPVLGPVAWIVTSLYVRSQQRAAGGDARPSTRPGRPAPRRRQGPVAPDDDPDFLWRLERDRRRREQGGSPDAPASAGGLPGDEADGVPEGPRAGDGDPGPGGPTGQGSGRDGGAGKDDDTRG